MLKTLTVLPLAVTLMAGVALAQNGNPGSEFMEQWDMDSDGAVTLDELRTKRGEVFYMFDVEGDGALAASDWAGVAAHVQEEQKIKGGGHGAGGNGRGPGAAMHAAMTPEFNDADGNGDVTLAEFEAASDRLFAALDRNGDHIVSATDF
ncbi:EF-hand domain-containing protein [Thioclava sp. FR2]|uniref:EF-hand domain-containing protein n=1 Tax=Thioclava sp. FR2 TaxID=3445780 RepID=UPI003EBF6320